MVRRSALLAAFLLAAAPLAAQDNAASFSPSPAPADNIGPRELSNFSLDGKVTRSAEPATTVPVPAEREPVGRATPPAATSTPERVAPVRSAASEPPRRDAGQRLAIDPIAGRPTLRQAAPATTSAAAAAAPAFSSPLANPAAPIEAPGGFSPLPWIAALLLLGAGVVVYFGLQRRGRRYAGTGIEQYFEASPQPDPTPQPAPRREAGQPLVRRPEPEAAPRMPAGVVTSSLRAASPAATPPGLVTSSLRPWIEVELEPSQALINDEHAAIAFDVTLYNSGSAPARDVAIEACLLNAGQQQDVELTQFYKNGGDGADTIPTVPPMGRIKLKSAVRLPRSDVQEYEIEGRKLFMPMVAISSRYRWSSGEGQSAASFLVGKAANDSAKLAPLRLDQGARGWKGLAARRYEKGIRK